eukprot:TRINITY_DN142290_c0_g1_i1.p4 TRINITY_DN142290_c0_g1~~TRINITY_DN142290_c0_g1_i1.p4  ORF type:complete len:203 (-),score=16.59 TRINITY_DN142290_c0_g1_i1:180-788(-)
MCPAKAPSSVNAIAFSQAYSALRTFVAASFSHFPPPTFGMSVRQTSQRNLALAVPWCLIRHVAHTGLPHLQQAMTHRLQKGTQHSVHLTRQVTQLRSEQILHWKEQRGHVVWPQAGFSVVHFALQYKPMQTQHLKLFSGCFQQSSQIPVLCPQRAMDWKEWSVFRFELQILQEEESKGESVEDCGLSPKVSCLGYTFFLPLR